MNVVVAALLLRLLVSVSALTSLAASGVTSSTVRPRLTPWNDVTTVLSSHVTVCESRGRCSEAVTSHSRGCFCDLLCGYYDDCCRDYQPEDGAAAGESLAHLPQGVATCQRATDTDTGNNNIETYKISRCPNDFGDVIVRRLCESEVDADTKDRFLLLPVAGNASLLLYRNVYCALCTGERNPVFWLGKLRYGFTQTSFNRTTVDLRDITRAAWHAGFAPVMELEGGSGDPRRCIGHIAGCHGNWTDDHLRRKCLSATNYVYAGSRAFRNRYCAVCNYVSESDLRCDDVRTQQQKTDVISGGDSKEKTETIASSSIVTLDFNRKHAVVMETTPGSGDVTERHVAFPVCSDDEGSVYDPYDDVCRKVTCPPEVHFPAANCFRKPETAPQNDGTAEENARSRDDDETEVDKSQKGQDDDVKSNGDASSFSSNSTPVAMTTGVTMATTTEADLEWTRIRFVLFRMDSLQRLLSLLGTLFCLFFLLLFILLHAAYKVLRTDPSSRYAVCLSVCLSVAHVLFVFIVLPSEDFPAPLPCFWLSVGIQYSYLTAFFWLNVMSIDAYKRLGVTQSTSPDESNGYGCFILFSLYAWLVPAVPMAASTVIAVYRVDGWDQLYEDGQVDGCFMLGLGQLLLFLIPVAIVVTMNVAVYVIITCRICLMPRPIRKEPEQVRQTIKQRKRFLTSVQLTVVMTTTWALALVAHLSDLRFFWFLFVVFDVLQGASVAVAFVVKVKVWRRVNAGSRSLAITKRSSENAKKEEGKKRRSDRAAIEPFVDAPRPPRKAKVPAKTNSGSSSSRLDRETSI